MKRYPKLISLLNEDFGKQKINEVNTYALTVSAILSIPAVMEGVAKLLKKIGKKHDKEFAAVEKIEHAAHKLHSYYQKPIKMIINGSYRATHKGKKMDPAKLQKATDIIFAIIVGCLASLSLVGAGKSFKEVIKHVKHSGSLDKASLLHVGLGILETVLGEMEIKEEIHLLQALTSPDHYDAFANAIDQHVDGHDKDHSKDSPAEAESIHEGLSRGSLYRKRYYGRY